MTSIGLVAGIEHLAAVRLRKAGVRTAEGLLARTMSTDSLAALSDETGLDSEKLMELAEAADFMRLQGMGSKYSALLRTAGIDTLEKLGACSPDAILDRLETANHVARLVRRLPSLKQVESWIRQARE